jgi:hypothetical protein
MNSSENSRSTKPTLFALEGEQHEGKNKDRTKLLTVSFNQLRGDWGQIAEESAVAILNCGEV